MKFDPSIFALDNPWFIGEMPNSYLILNFDQSYLARVILVPKEERADLESLSSSDLGLLMAEVSYVGRRLKSEFAADRMNYASLGNVVEQLHWHIIPRYKDDANWGGPPWPVHDPREPSDDERSAIIVRVRRALKIDDQGVARIERVFPLPKDFRDAYWTLVTKTLVEVFEVSAEPVAAHREKVDAAPFHERLDHYMIPALELASRLAGVEVTEVHLERYHPLLHILGSK
jgi:diadenosine tetraphosphate (Ap4A) HIT family hydrolase